jgi:hypothetical protein
LSQVPLYYFNVCCDGAETTDLVGEVCANDVEALAHALRTAGGWLHKSAFTHHSVHDGWIGIEDERHREVMKLPLMAAAY